MQFHEYKPTMDALSAPFSGVLTKPGRGEQTFQYVPVHDVIRRLNDILGPTWSFNVVTSFRDGDFVIVHGRITFSEVGSYCYTKDQFGSSDIKFKRGTKEPLDIGNDYKAAASDALKKCATQLGVALYLSDSGKITATQRATIEALLKAKNLTLTTELEACLEKMSEDEATALIEQLRGNDAA